MESSPTILDGVDFVGSSDAARVYAFDVRAGRRLWDADVFGWARGQPAVANDRVYVSTSSRKGYLATHRAGVFALDRRTGRAAWRYEAAAPESCVFGFPGSPAVGAGLVFTGGLDGKLFAFPQ